MFDNIRSTSRPFFQFLSSNGDGTGRRSAISNFTPDTNSLAQVFYIQPPKHLKYDISRMLVHIEDNANFSADNYGGLTNPLTNGVIVRVRTQPGSISASNSGTNNVIDLTPDPVNNNAEWGQYAYDVAYVEFGVGNNFQQVRWTFSKTGAPIFLRGWRGDRLEVVLQDDFSGLVSHTFQVQGVATMDPTSVPWSGVSTNDYTNVLSNVAGTNVANSNKLLGGPPAPPF